MTETKIIEIMIGIIGALVGVVGLLVWYLFSKIMLKLDYQMEQHQKCREEFLGRFVDKIEFMDFMKIRAQDHASINQRLYALESHHKELMIKMDLFMKDTDNKLTRLSATFVDREAAISARLDKIADRQAVA